MTGALPRSRAEITFLGGLLVAATIIVTLLLVVLGPFGGSTGCVAALSPQVSTDTQDYAPGENVTISGSDFREGAVLTVVITAPTGIVTSADIVADPSGAFTHTYQIPTENAGGRYTLDVLDADGNIVAGTVFSDSHFRFGHLTYVASSTASTTALFTLKNAFRRNSYTCRDAPSTTVIACTGPVVGATPRAGPGDFIRETIGGTDLEFGDGTDTPTLLYIVDAIDAAGNWLQGTALNPGTTDTVIPHTYSSGVSFVLPGTGVTVSESEPNDTATPTDSMALGDDYAGDIADADPDDMDFVSFFASAGTVIDARTVLGTLDDSILSLFDTDGTTLLDSNDDCEDLESCIENFTIPADGTCFLMVEGFSGSDMGTYTLQLREFGFGDPRGPFVAKIESCCRTSAEENNPGDGYQVEAIVDLRGGNTGNPISSLPAIVDCPFPAVCNFNIPAVDIDGDPIGFRFSTPTESGDSGFNQPGLPPSPVAPNPASISSTGLYSWDTTGAPGGAGALYSTQVTIEELGTSSAPFGKSALDFLIRLATGTPPAFDVPPTPAVGTNFPVSPGGNVNFTVRASDGDVQDDVAVSHLGLPTGATLTCGTVGNPTTCTFDWTPSVDDLGVHVITFTAQDQGGLNAAPHGITITVFQEQVPRPPARRRPTLLSSRCRTSAADWTPLT